MLMVKRSFATLSLLTCVSASAADDTALTGHFRIGGKTLHDAPPGERHDTHAYFEITGASARALYASMKVRAEPDACGDPGTLAKRIRNLQCSKRAAKRDEYRCWFGIDLHGQQIVNGVVC